MSLDTKLKDHQKQGKESEYYRIAKRSTLILKYSSKLPYLPTHSLTDSNMRGKVELTVKREVTFPKVLSKG